MTGGNRILRALRGESLDRVPIEIPIPLDLVRWGEGWRPEGGWMAEENYLRVAEAAGEHCDSFWGCPGVGHLFDRRFAMVPAERVHIASDERVNGRRTVTYVVSTPRGDLRTVETFDEGVNTWWYPEPLCKSKEDAEKLLSVPFEVGEVDLSQYLQARERAGERVAPQVSISTPLVSAGRLLHFDQWLEWCASDFGFVDRLVAAHAERIGARLKAVLEAGVGPVFWFGGSEQATPPMMSRELFEKLVVKYDGPLMRMVKDCGCYVHVHCHGKVDAVLEHFMDMGADCLDPCEPHPDGDLDFAEAKRRARGRMVLIGNIEFRHMEHLTPDQIEEKVKRAILDGGPKGMILGLSATGISSVTDRYRDNCLRYIEAGLEYGAR